MHPIEQALLSSISKSPDTPLVVAYSGGVDSQVLLNALASLKQKNLFLNVVTVCHVNHGLSENAIQWQEFAVQQCQHQNLALRVHQVNIQPKAQQSLEALARDARYKALQSIYNKPSLIITGHHCDDQAETFLLALKRGSGLKGLSAMAKETKQAKDLLVRPLLNISRAQIMDYATEHNLTWVEDESNTDTRFDRNFIRNDIMPLLTKRWPSIINTINRSSEHCLAGQSLLDELAVDDLNICLNDDKNLSVTALNKLSLARFNNLVRYFLAQNYCLMPSTEQLSQLHQQLNANIDKNPSVKVGDHYLRRYKKALYLTTDFQRVSDWYVELKGLDKNQEIELPDNLGKLQFSESQPELAGRSDLNEARQSEAEVRQGNSKNLIITLPNTNSKVSIRFKHNNPSCLPDYRNHSRSLKKVMQELDIPPWQRKRIPFLYYDNVLVAVIGYFVCQEYLAKLNEPCVEVAWFIPEPLQDAGFSWN